MFYRWLIVASLVVLAVAVIGVTVGSTPAEKEAPPKAAPAAPSKEPAAAYKSVVIKDVPHVRQKPDFCGEACAAMYLQRLGWNVDQDWVFDQSGLDPMEARGCYTKELAAALANIGFRTGPVWYKISVAKQDEHLEAHWKALHEDLTAGVGSIVCTYYDAQPDPSEHFRLILGYDGRTDEVIYHEPSEAAGAYRRMKRTELLKLWPLKYSAEESTVIRLRLEPGQLRPGAAASTFTAADYAQHIMRLKKKVPEGFTIVIQHPFLVIGDESAATVRQRAVGTVKWSVDRLKQAYFTKDPDEILDVWLFKDDESYRKHAKEIFGHEPSTPYGYFSAADGALVMNIRTGGGTLVHEIVHPFVAANFPECPAWLNEGLGSLYEQSGEDRYGRIIGRTNWRLAGLQKAIREKRVPAFEDLCTTTTTEFYEMDRGTNYAQARYLCYYLQEHGLLRKFYSTFHANHREDPSGYKTLVAVLGSEDMDQFKKDWEAYVLRLRFP